MIPGDIAKNSNSAGVVTESASDRRSRDGFEIGLKIALAGMAAQYRAFPDSLSIDDMAGHAGADMLNASTFALAIALLDAGMTPAETTEITDALDDAAASICGDFARMTDDLVVEHWPAIKRVGYALVERDVLDQYELDALISDSG